MDRTCSPGSPAPVVRRVTRVQAASSKPGSAAPGYSSGAAMAEVEKLAAQLPPGFGYEWTGQALEQKQPFVGTAGTVIERKNAEPTSASCFHTSRLQPSSLSIFEGSIA